MRSDNIFFQCFDALELKRVRGDLHSDLKLIQLIGENSWQESSTDYDAMRTERGMADVAAYADGIGPEITQLVKWPHPGAGARLTGLSTLAHSSKLLVHAYTLRLDELPANAPSGDAVLNALFDQAKVDGLFTDFTDFMVRFRAAHRPDPPATP